MAMAGLILIVTFLSLVFGSSPPKDPPEDMRAAYTLNNQIPLAQFYVDDTNQGHGSHYRFSLQQIEKMIQNSLNLFTKIEKVSKGFVDQELPSDVLLKQLRKEDWIYFALLNYSQALVGSDVAVIGSSSPWVECLLLSLGAGHVTTIEYNKLTYDHPNLTTVSGEQFEEFYSSSSSPSSPFPSSPSPSSPSQGRFDYIFSMSSFDHDGLGRYGDPLSPSGDLQSMARVKTLLKPATGRLFLTVPIGPDVIVWNLHRRYGKVRLPLLLDGWEIVDRVGWEEEKLEKEANWRQSYEPILILKPSLLEPSLVDQNNDLNSQPSNDEL
jgi:hypothetical protein